jgi:hypothetical protein
METHQFCNKEALTGGGRERDQKNFEESEPVC